MGVKVSDCTCTPVENVPPGEIVVETIAIRCVHGLSDSIPPEQAFGKGAMQLAHLIGNIAGDWTDENENPSKHIDGILVNWEGENEISLVRTDDNTVMRIEWNRCPAFNQVRQEEGDTYMDVRFHSTMSLPDWLAYHMMLRIMDSDVINLN